MTADNFDLGTLARAIAAHVTGFLGETHANGVEQTIYEAYDGFYQGLERIGEQVLGHIENLGEIEQIVLDADSEITPYGEEKLMEHIPRIRKYLESARDYIDQLSVADKATLAYAKESGLGGPDTHDSIIKLMQHPLARRLTFYNLRTNTMRLANSAKESFRELDSRLDAVMEAYVDRKFQGIVKPAETSR